MILCTLGASYNYLWVKIANSNKGIVRESLGELAGSLEVITNENSWIQENAWNSGRN